MDGLKTALSDLVTSILSRCVIERVVQKTAPTPAGGHRETKSDLV